MAKKFGKVLLATLAIGSAAAAVYFYMQKKEAARNTPTEDDYDDFCDDLADDSESCRNYVALTPDTAAEEIAETDETPETEESQPSEAPETADEGVEETVEEFFDEGDTLGEEPAPTEY